MTCSRCGADAAIKRDNAYYCGRCAVSRDWGEIIAVVQDGPRTSNRVIFEAADAEEPQPDPVPAAPGSGDPFAT